VGEKKENTSEDVYWAWLFLDRQSAHIFIRLTDPSEAILFLNGKVLLVP